MESLKTFRKPDTEHAWERVHQRLRADGLLPERRETVRMTTVRQWMVRAASVLVIIALGGLSYFLISDMRSSRLLTLETGTDNSTFVQTFEDGSVVYIADNSILNYPQTFRGARRKVSLRGEAFFDVVPREGQPFVIETNNAMIEVLGTAFNLRSYDDDFELIVEQGLVRVFLKDTPERQEVVGNWEMLTGMKGRMEKSTVIDRTYVSWKMNRMQFRDERLDNIASVVSRNYNIDIDFENEAIKERRMTVTFRDNSINTIAEVIAFSMELDYEITEDPGIVFRDRR